MEMPLDMEGKTTIEIGQTPRSDSMTMVDTLTMKFEHTMDGETKQFVSSYTLGKALSTKFVVV